MRHRYQTSAVVLGLNFIGSIRLYIHLLGAIVLASFVLTGCSSQNEYLSKGKELVKSDKRRKEERAVRQFFMAVKTEPNNAEANYLLGYYNSFGLYAANRRDDWESWLNDNDSQFNWSFDELKDRSGFKTRGEYLFKSYQQKPGKYLEILVFETLRTQSDELQKAAQEALVRVFEKGNKDKLLAHLRKAMKSKDNRDRHDAQQVLSAIARSNPQHSSQIVKELKPLLKYRRRMETRLNAVKALGDIGSSEAVLELVEIINARRAAPIWQQVFSPGNIRDQEPAEIRQLAVVALAQIGIENADSAAVEKLIGIVKNKGSSLRVDAIEALAEIVNTNEVLAKKDATQVKSILLEVLREEVRREITVNL